MNFGGGALTSAGGTDVFVVKYTPTGAHLWSKRIGGVSGDQALSVAADGSGNVAVTGVFSGTVDFGGGPLTSAGGVDVFVAKYSASGAHLWSRRIGASNSDSGYGVATDATGNVIVTGSFVGTIDCGGGPLTSSVFGTAPSLFVAKYSATGAHVWSKTFWGDADSTAYGVAADGGGNVLVTGWFRGSIDFGGGALSSGSGASTTVFVAKLTAAGAHVWSREFGGIGVDMGRGVAVDGNGNVLVTGLVAQAVDFGGGLMATTTNDDVFVAKYTPTGQYAWAKRFGGGYTDTGYAIAADLAGNVIVTGDFADRIDFGGGPLSSGGNTDAFMAKLAATTGGHLWSKRLGGEFDDGGLGVAVAVGGNVTVTGFFAGSANDGLQTIVSAGGTDGFLRRLGP